jgi:predicted dehydrogenase
MGEPADREPIAAKEIMMGPRQDLYAERGPNRRGFLVGAAAAVGVGARFAWAEPTGKPIRMGIVGGRFGLSFFFHEHPGCMVQAVSDLRPDRRSALMKTYRCERSYESLERLIEDPEVDAVGVFTPAPDHARHVLACLKAGKHVLCAVPAALTLEECEQIVEAVRATGLTYMMAETSYYQQGTISAREFARSGAFGTVFSVESEYHHPGLESLWTENGKPTWRHGFPPMLYPTHCTAHLVSVLNERLTRVSCIGWGDEDPLIQNNVYQNPFWNETAFFQTERNTAFRVAVYWKGALRGTERAQWLGDRMSFFFSNPNGLGPVLVKAGTLSELDSGGFARSASVVEPYDQPAWWKTDRLPEPLRHDSGHEGSHTFLTHEFIDALQKGRKPAIDVIEAVNYTAPGIVAHESALKGGESLAIPSFGA